jgi:hypothetical protein
MGSECAPINQPYLTRSTGKPEAGIRSVGIGDRASGKLVSRYGTIRAILEAAERGELAGWGINVRLAFSSSNLANTAEQLRRNAGAVSICQDTGIVDPMLTAAVQAAIRTSWRPMHQAHQSSAGASDRQAPGDGIASSVQHAERERARQLAWMHPDAALRWRLVQPHAQALEFRLAAAGILHSVQHALQNGCTIDIAVFDRTDAVDSECAAITAIMLRTAADLLPTRTAFQGPANLKMQLSNRALQHRKLLSSCCKAVVDVDCTAFLDLSSVIASVLQH